MRKTTPTLNPNDAFEELAYQTTHTRHLSFRQEHLSDVPPDPVLLPTGKTFEFRAGDHIAVQNGEIWMQGVFQEDEVVRGPLVFHHYGSIDLREEVRRRDRLGRSLARARIVRAAMIALTMIVFFAALKIEGFKEQVALLGLTLVFLAASVTAILRAAWVRWRLRRDPATAWRTWAPARIRYILLPEHPSVRA